MSMRIFANLLLALALVGFDSPTLCQSSSTYTDNIDRRLYLRYDIDFLLDNQCLASDLGPNRGYSIDHQMAYHNHAYWIIMNAFQEALTMSAVSGDFDFPPGLSSEEKIAHLQGKLARRCFETEKLQRRMLELEAENKILREAHSGGGKSTLDSASVNAALKRRRHESISSANHLEPINQIDGISRSEKGRIIDSERDRVKSIIDQVKSIRSELSKVSRDTDEMVTKFNSHLKELNCGLGILLDPKTVLRDLVPQTAKENGYILVREQHLTDLLRIVCANMSAIASSLSVAAGFQAKPK